MTTPQEPTGASTPEQHINWWWRPISEDRQVELDALAAQQRRWAEQPEATRGESPLKDVHFTGADVFWLAKRALAGPDGDAAALADAETRLGFQVDLSALHLEGAFLINAQLAGASLRGAHLEQAILIGAYLEGAFLRYAHLEQAILESAQLETADLSEAHLEGAILIRAQLEGANLDGAYLDEDTRLEDAHLGPGTVRDWLDHLLFRNHNAALGDIKWRGADLTAVPWEQIRRLGDERDAGFTDGAHEHRAVARAYRQVATQLRDQGMAEDADRFSYRAQIRQRGVLLRTFRLPQYLFSWVLALLAGYGYRPGRTLFWYLVTIAGFMWGYLQVTHGAPLFGLYEPVGTQPLQWYEALVQSVASFHGRGFFPQGINLGDPVAILAAIEAVIGLFIEISFIATFTQRYFGNK